MGAYVGSELYGKIRFFTAFIGHLIVTEKEFLILDKSAAPEVAVRRLLDRVVKHLQRILYLCVMVTEHFLEGLTSETWHIG